MNSLGIFVAALLAQQSFSQTITLEVFLDSASCSSSCDRLSADEPMAYFEVNGDGRKYIKCSSYSCAQMESPSTTVAKYKKTFDCSSSQITSVSVCAQFGDDDSCFISILDPLACLAKGRCDDLGCRANAGCQVTNMGFCRTGSCSRTVTKSISASSSRAGGTQTYRIRRSGFCPTPSPTLAPTTKAPTFHPTKRPTRNPTSKSPTRSPVPTPEPTASPSDTPTNYPTGFPTNAPSTSPSMKPTRSPVTPVPTPDPTTLTPTVSPVTISPTAPLSESMGVAAMAGIASAGVACLSVAFFFIYRRKYSRDSAGTELVEKKAAMDSSGWKVETLSPESVSGGSVRATSPVPEAGKFVPMRVAFDFTAEEEDELSAMSGTILHITGMVNEDWAIGFNPNTGVGGMIPKSCLEDPENDQKEDEVTNML